MIVMEGLMLVPPERGTIIGRAIWKPRYVVLATGAALKAQNELAANADNSVKSTSRKGLKATSSKPSLVDVAQPGPENRRLYIAIYKAKGDWECITQYPVSAFKSCETRAVQHRKQSPCIQTLMLEMKPDSPSDKQRKRRSSRTAGLTSKDPWGNILLFRTVTEDPHNIYEWQQRVKPLLTPDEPEDSPLSPISPMFTNPFGSSRQTSNSNSKVDFQVRPSTQHQNSYPHAPPPRERPSALISPSPSLRSRRSDLSSQSSSLHPPMGFTSAHPQTYGTLPNDLPSPASTSGYEPQFIEGWTSAQGRSSALSSHTRGSNSIASAVAPALPGSIGSTPPGPRETILDRAFQMRYIPGSERVPSTDDEKISSIARFEALMAEHDQRKQAKLATSQSRREGKDWDLDEESENSEPGEVDEDEDDADGLEMSDQEITIPTPAQRALDYISGRIPPPQRTLSPPRSPPIPFLNSQAMNAFHGNPPPSTSLRPRTGTTSSRNGGSRPNSIALPSRSISTTAVPSLREGNGGLQAGTDEKLKRRSSTSVKRLSFSEFAKRLSSTSSLLLVQTNASSSTGRDGSRRGSSEYGVEEPHDRERERLGLRGGGSQHIATMAMGMGESRSDRDKRCGWRGSVGVFGAEGGFV
ncbi:hypothetical protein L207DRAFT_579966 [Hyaloscypha variabilis F]|uniref:Uncharacterized protein n=1 Tax=Hyaloscypha variabilis (strain UAMH 11265 / GT02V1 / F) TaxID=1149755 RepID=A0A2J6RX59_HYAVF|nr:hypothetical protein L207DRAFT_579966 [Hyaloscypha variabilis F]